MNPFDLLGPQFLVFYAIYGAIVLALAAQYRRTREDRPIPKMDLDPYAIAYLRSGANETARVAIVSLVDRGLLSVQSDRVGRAPTADPQKVRHPIEQYLLERFRAPGKVIDIFQDRELEELGEPYQQTFESHGLFPTAEDRQARAMLLMLVLALLLGVGVTKFAVAMSRGRHNVMFLIILTIVFAFLAKGVCDPRLTRAGSAFLNDLRTLYASLRNRASAIRPGGATVELVTLAAVFGLGALSTGSFGYAKALFPKATQAGSSCGSSCGGSCGGGCGGGGCGGCGS